MDWVHGIYWVCLLVGLVYLFVVLTLGSERALVALKPYSPLLIAFGLAAFGAGGILMSVLFHHRMRPFTMPLALAAGALLAWGLLFISNKWLAVTEVVPEAGRQDSVPPKEEKAAGTDEHGQTQTNTDSSEH